MSVWRTSKALLYIFIIYVISAKSCRGAVEMGYLSQNVLQKGENNNNNNEKKKKEKFCLLIRRDDLAVTSCSAEEIRSRSVSVHAARTRPAMATMVHESAGASAGSLNSPHRTACRVQGVTLTRLFLAVPHSRRRVCS